VAEKLKAAANKKPRINRISIERSGDHLAPSGRCIVRHDQEHLTSALCKSVLHRNVVRRNLKTELDVGWGVRYSAIFSIDPQMARCRALAREYDRGAAELRTDELMRVAAGLPVPGLDSLKDLRFPEAAQ
jgi:hypothetical protein